MMNVIEGNKLIAEFMGWELTTMNWRENYRHFELSIKYGEECYTNNDGKFAKGNGLSFKYHTSWDWLMPVVEKINETGVFRVYIHFGGNGTNPIYDCYVDKIEWINRYPNITKICGKSGIESSIKVVWLAVIEFINWYNSQSK